MRTRNRLMVRAAAFSVLLVTGSAVATRDKHPAVTDESIRTTWDGLDDLRVFRMVIDSDGATGRLIIGRLADGGGLTYELEKKVVSRGRLDLLFKSTTGTVRVRGHGVAPRESTMVGGLLDVEMVMDPGRDAARWKVRLLRGIGEITYLDLIGQFATRVKK